MHKVDEKVLGWQAVFPGIGSFGSVTLLTRSNHEMEAWKKGGAEITPLVAAKPNAEAVVVPDEMKP